MRFVVTGEWTRNRLLKVIVWCFLAYTVILWVTNAGLYFAKMLIFNREILETEPGHADAF